MRSGNGIAALAGMAMLMAMSSAPLPRKSRRCTYHRFCGPPHPTTRQQKRALQRQSAAMLSRITADPA